MQAIITTPLNPLRASVLRKITLRVLRVSPKARAGAFKSLHLLLSLLEDWEFWRLGGLNMLYSYRYCYFPQRRRAAETCVVT